MHYNDNVEKYTCAQHTKVINIKDSKILESKAKIYIYYFKKTTKILRAVFSQETVIAKSLWLYIQSSEKGNVNQEFYIYPMGILKLIVILNNKTIDNPKLRKSDTSRPTLHEV